jgi:ATP-grasp domain, R2K clade family 2
MPTLILTPRQTEDTQSLWKAAARLGWSTERLGGWRIPDHVRSIDEPVLYAEALFGPDFAEQLGLHLLSPPDDWLVGLPMEYKSRTIRLTTLGEARLLERPMFVKPPNDKTFPAQAYTGATLPTGYDDDMPVLVSDLVEWDAEFRCFILDRVLHTFSVYSRGGELQREQGFHSSAAEDEALRAFVDRVLADPRVILPKATVLDVGTLRDGRWACVEQNAAWGAGIYGCDPERVLDVVRAASSRPTH